MAAVTFRVGTSSATPSSTAAADPPPSPADTAQDDGRAAADDAPTTASESPSAVNPWVDTSAALCASAATSLLEGPVEMFRHRLQVCSSVQGPLFPVLMCSRTAYAFDTRG